MYGPTNLVSLVAVKRGGFKDLTLPPMTSNMLNAALLDPPPTGKIFPVFFSSCSVLFMVFSGHTLPSAYTRDMP